ncbi:MAG TPA: CapA family protein [Spirochaetota bacterium]|nr:CapA family protein [Spirochaetota bacterium]HPI88664.1 CapA family protein [Spirochaetota bacterium]HPR49105.1 CapA family protein [Spirochaetota bacterium]
MFRVIKKTALISLVLVTVAFIGCDNTDSILSVGGTVLCEGSGLEGAAVNISMNGSAVADVQTDENGAYLAENLSEGTYQITPSLEGYTFVPEYLEVSLSGANSLRNDFTAVADSDPDDPDDPGSDDPDDPGSDDPGNGEPVSLIFVGDINYAHFVEEVIQEPTKGNGDYTYPFHYVADYLSGADITFGNLESLISDQGDDTKNVLSKLGYGLSLRAAPDSIEGFLYAGFDILNLANNHTGDYDVEAMEDCVNRLDAAGIDHIGVGENHAAAHAPVIKEVKGTTIAFLGYSNVPMYADDTWFSPTCEWIARGPENDDEERWGLAWASDYRFEQYGDFSAMQDDISSAKERADIVIVSVHFGWEYAQMPDTNEDGEAASSEQKAQAQQQMAHMAIDAGASLVVGHHPHVVQWLDDAKTTAVESYNGGYIAYSLGNFMFDISSERDETAPLGLLLNVTVKNGAIDSIEQVKTYYLDDYWQTYIE